MPHDTFSKNALLLLSGLLLFYLVFVVVFQHLPGAAVIGHYLSIHTAFEAFSIVVSCMIFGITWSSTADWERSRGLAALGAGFLCVGLLDFAHLLSYQGMPLFVTPSSPQKAIVFWLAARLVAVAALSVAVFSSSQSLRKRERWCWLAGFLGLTLLVGWAELFHPQSIPLFWRDGTGLTYAKLAVEAFLVVVCLVAAVFSYRALRDGSGSRHLGGLTLAACVMALSELWFMSYSDVNDVFNLLGHLYKVVAYAILYQVLFVGLVREPFQRLEQARNEIWLEKERAEVTLQSIMDGVITTDANGLVTYLNAVASQLTGLSLESARSQPIGTVFRVFDESTNQPIENPVTQCLQQQRAVLLSEQAIITSTFGHAYAIEQVASPIVNRQGKIIGVVMVFREVTERRRTDEKIRKSERSLLEAQAIAKLGSWEWWIPENRIEWSAEMYNIFDYRPVDGCVRYEDFLSCLHPEDASRVEVAVGRALTELDSYEVEYRVVHKNGDIRHIYARGEVQRNTGGKPIRMHGIVQDITERKRIAEQLHASLMEIEDLYEHAPCGYHSLDADGVIQRINQTELNWLGYSRDELVGKMAFTDILTPDSIRRFHENYPGFKHSGVAKDFEYELQRKDGSRFFVLLNATAIYDQDGNFQLSRSTLFDISDRRKAELALADNEKSLRKAQAIAHLGSWEWDVASGEQWWSEETYRIFGLHQLMCKPNYDSFIDLVDPDDRGIVLANVQTALYGDVSYSSEYRIKRPSGEVRYIYSQAEVIRNEAGKPLRMIGTNLDITERKLAEIKIRSKEAEQRRQAEIQTSILDALPANLALLNTEGVIVEVNRRWREFAAENGLTRTGFGLGSNYLQVCDDFAQADEHAALARNGLQRVLFGDLAQFALEYPCHSSERQRWFRMLAVPLSSRERLGAVVMHLDITESWQYKVEIEKLNQDLEQRVAERTRELQAVNQELEAFSYSVSHDLRAPLRIIDGFAHMLDADYGSSLTDDAKQHLTHILQAARRMGELIEDLLQLSLVNRSQLKPEDVNLSRMVGNIAADLKTTAPERACRFTIAPGLSAKGDSHLLRILLENLLGNAWKFTRTRALAEIEFGSIYDGEHSIYFIRDNGVGFDEKYAHKLFGAFQRLHSEDEFEGTGIGLATVHRVLSRHDGRIWAESQLGQGATFYFRL